MICSPAGDLVGDPPSPQEPPVLVKAIAAIGDDPLGPVPWPAGAPPDMGDRIDQCDRFGDVVAVGRGCRPAQQEPPGVGQDVVLGTRPAAVDRARPEPGAPFLACTYEASTIARDQSI